MFAFPFSHCFILKLFILIFITYPFWSFIIYQVPWYILRSTYACLDFTLIRAPYPRYIYTYISYFVFFVHLFSFFVLIFFFFFAHTHADCRWTCWWRLTQCWRARRLPSETSAWQSWTRSSASGWNRETSSPVNVHVFCLIFSTKKKKNFLTGNGPRFCFVFSTKKGKKNLVYTSYGVW